VVKNLDIWASARASMTDAVDPLAINFLRGEG